MLILSIVSLSLCFSFGYLALANALVAYRLQQERRSRYKNLPVAWIDRRFWPPTTPISFL